MAVTSAAGTSILVLECSSVSVTSVSTSASGLMNNIPSYNFVRRSKAYSKRRSCCANLENHSYGKPFQNPVSKCVVWNYEERRWNSRIQAKVVATTLPDTWVASDEATAIAAAEEAMALARAALLAAKEAAMANSNDIFTSSELELVNWNTILEPEPSRISPVAEPVANDDNQLLEREDSEATMNAALGMKSLASDVETKELEPEQEFELYADNERLKSEKKVEVVVSSKRRMQRVLKRAKANDKKRKDELPAEKGNITGLLPLKAAKKPVGKDGYCPQIIRRIRMTQAEELESINGIQDLYKMEAIKQNLKEQLGRDPAFREWANALNIEPRALETRLYEVRRCKNMMVSSNLGLIIKAARKFAMRGVAIEDLIQEGINGLLRGVEKFDTSRGFRLSTYVLWWIELSVRRASVKRSLLCQVPMHLFDMYTRVMKTRARIYEERGEFPTDEEVAKLIGTTPTKVHMAGNLLRRPKSLDSKLSGDGGTLMDILEDTETESAFVVAERELLKKQLDKVLDQLKPKEKEVLVLRYGIRDGRVRTLEEVSHTFDLSRERVRQIEKAALTKIHDMGGKEQLASFANTFT